MICSGLQGAESLSKLGVASAAQAGVRHLQVQTLLLFVSRMG